jgi:cytoskeletal protein CcmA (bactofilin family)
MNRLFIAFFALFFIPNVVWGASSVRTGEMVTISPDQVVEDDFYGMGNTVVVSGEITKDLLSVSADLTVNGKVGADMTVASGRVDVHGTVGEDLRVLAGEVVIAGEVKGDLVVVAKTLKVLSTAKIDGDVMFFGTDADISGSIGGDILGNSEKIRIDSEVKGGVDIATGALTLGDKADIGAGVKYTSFQELTRAQNAHITKDVVKNDPVSPVDESNAFKSVLIPFLIIAFASLVWYLFFRGFLQKIVVGTRTHALRNALIGFGILFVMPIASFILIISALGSLLGMALMFAYVLLLIASFITMGVVAGSLIARTAVSSGDVSIAFILLGVFSVNVLMYVPIIGPIILVGLMLVTLGAITVHLYRFLRAG